MGDEFFDADHTFTRAALTHVSQVPHPCLNNWSWCSLRFVNGPPVTFNVRDFLLFQTSTQCHVVMARTCIFT